jgi:ABC-2 type transport system ATP-binding protein
VDGLAKNFGPVQALRGVSFSVEPGEVFGYLGPNGAGKTTTLRIVVGLVRATGGAVRLFGRSPQDPRSREQLGFLPGDLHLYGDLTARQLLDYFARFRPGQPPSLRPELIERLGLEAAVLPRRVKFLSHGTRQKLGLIVAMQHDPALLLLDEPSNGLDPLVQQSFREIVRDFAGRGRSVLVSSHVLSEVEVICQRVAILRQGVIVALETIEQLRANVVRRLTVHFEKAVPEQLLKLDTVTRSETDGSTATLWVRGDLNPLLRALADARVQDFVFPEPELEDIFLSYYRSAPVSNA